MDTNNPVDEERFSQLIFRAKNVPKMVKDYPLGFRNIHWLLRNIWIGESGLTQEEVHQIEVFCKNFIISNNKE